MNFTHIFNNTASKYWVVMTMAFLVSSCTLKGNITNLDPDKIPTLSIETKADGTGDKVEEAYVLVGETKNLYLIKRDKKGNLREALDIVWENSDPTIGNIVLSKSKRQAIFTGIKVGQTNLKIVNNDFETEIKVHVVQSMQILAPTSLVLLNPSASPGNNATPTITVGGVESGYSVGVYTNSNCSTLVGSATSSGSSVNVTLSPALAEGNYTFYAASLDAAGNLSSCSVASVAYTVDLTPPAAILTGVPTGNSADTNLSITVGGVGVVAYKYKLVEFPYTLDCSSALNYSSEIISSTLILDNIAALADGGVRVCVVARDAAENYQSYASATQATWTKVSAPTIEFATTTSSQSESVTTKNIAVNLSHAFVNTVTVDYAVTGGSAVGSGEDYTLSSGTLTFAAGVTTQNISVTIINDAYYEDDESLIVDLSNPTQAVLGADVQHTLTIQNDDALPVSIYRSVGPTNTAALATGTSNALTISSGVATFATALPNNIGVGDAIQYDSDNNGTIDRIIFISGRVDSTHYAVQTNLGAAPADMAVSDLDWSIYRAYTSLENAKHGIENSGINAGLVNFDNWTDFRNMKVNNEKWFVAVYGDAQDTISAGNGIRWDWIADKYQTLKVYSPYLVTEVGASQRHNGYWDNSKARVLVVASQDYQRGIRIATKYSEFEGLQMRVQSNGWGGSSAFFTWSADTEMNNSRLHINSNIIVGECVSSSCTGISISDHTGKLTYIYNNILYYTPDTPDVNFKGVVGYGTLYVYQNTFLGSAWSLRGFDNFVAKNNLFIGASSTVYSPFAAASTKNVSENNDSPSAANDKRNVTVDVVNRSGFDFRLASTDVQAAGFGVDLSTDPYLPITKDILNKTRTAPYDVGASMPVFAGIASIAGVPSGTISTTDLDITVSGSGITHYQYKIGISGSIDCSTSVGYSSSIPVATPITDDISALADGTIVICVLGVNADGDVQSLTAATSSSWTKDTIPVAIYRSVGPGSTTAIATGAGNSLSVTSGVATLVSAPTDGAKIGVGDVIQYDSNNDGTVDALAFITYRNSSTSYNVQSVSGGVPFDTSSPDQDWAVFRAYTSFANALAGTENTGINAALRNFDTWSGGKNLITSNEQWNIALYNDAVETANISTWGWTTSKYEYLRFYTPVNSNEVGFSQRHRGALGSGYQLKGEIYSWTNSLHIDGLSIHNSTNADAIYLHNIHTTRKGEVKISNCFILTDNNTTGDKTAIVSTSSNRKFYAWNNIIIAIAPAGDAKALYINAETNYVYNNTIISSNHAVIFNWGNNYVKNNIFVGWFTSWGGSLVSCLNNSISSNPGNCNDASNRKSQTFSFEDSTLNKYWLKSEDSGAKNFGSDLSADPYLSFTTDIHGHTRSGTWDIGAHEAPNAIYRSVGPDNTSPLANGAGNNLTIFNGVATFASGLPTNVGVGDAVQYDANNNGSIDSIIFIVSIITPTTYAVQTASGGVPTNLAEPDQDWSILRAYTGWNAAISNTENTGIDASVRNFDSYTTTRDIFSLNEQWHIAIYADANQTGSVSFTNWNTGPSNYVKFFAPSLSSEVGVSQRHTGVWDSNKSAIVVTSGSPLNIGGVVTPRHIRVEGIQMENNTLNSGAGIYTIEAYNRAHSEVYIVGNIIRKSNGFTNGWNNGNEGIAYKAGSDSQVFILNNMISGFAVGYFTYTTSTFRVTYFIANNTIVAGAATAGIDLGGYGSGEGYMYNNLIQGTSFSTAGISCGGNFNCTGKASNNLTSDGTSVGTTAFVNKTVTFKDAPLLDYRISNSDIEAKENGVDLSTHPYYPISTDISGATRTNPWDIGASLPH